MEFYDVHFSYIDNETFEEEFVSVPEQGGDKLIPEGMGKPGHIYTVAHGDSGMIGVYKIETEVVSGTGKFERTGLGTSREARENLNTAFNYFKANKKNISGTISLSNNDFPNACSRFAGNWYDFSIDFSSLYCPLFWSIKKTCFKSIGGIRAQ
jgi:ATP-dependent Lon protease